MYAVRRVIQGAAAVREERPMSGEQDSEGRRARAVQSVCACWLLALAGCGGGSAGGSTRPGDPLLGNQPPVPVVAAGAATPKTEPAGPLPVLASRRHRYSVSPLPAGRVWLRD